MYELVMMVLEPPLELCWKTLSLALSALQPFFDGDPVFQLEHGTRSPLPLPCLGFVGPAARACCTRQLDHPALSNRWTV
jgi:hypothetical protein